MIPIQSVFDEYDFNITYDQQRYILDNEADKTPKELARIVFKKPELEERDPQVQMIKKFIGRDPSKIWGVELDEEQRKKIQELAVTESPFEVAKIIHNNQDLGIGSRACKTVMKYIEVLESQGVLVAAKEKKYIIAEDIFDLTSKVNQARPGASLNRTKLSNVDKRHLSDLRLYLKSQRFISTINSIQKDEEKKLFEHEFINGVYEKELNTEDVNMYISLAKEYVTQLQINKVIESLNADLEETMGDDDKSLKMAFVESIKIKTDEYDKCSKRITTLQGALSTNYSKREGHKATMHASLIPMIEKWKDQEDRRRMIMLADARKTEVAKEIDRIEDEHEFIARVYGISREEILNG